MKRLWQIFLRGLATVLPIAVTISILYWIGVSLESVLGGFVKIFLPDRFYLPGTGLLLALAAVFIVGATVHAWIIRKLIDIGESLIERIPLAKSIYGGHRGRHTGRRIHHGRRSENNERRKQEGQPHLGIFAHELSVGRVYGLRSE